MSDKKNVQNNIDDKEKAEKPKEKTLENINRKPLSDEVKQRIAGLAVIGVITVGLCITGLVGKFNGDSIPTASVSSSVSSNESSASYDESSASAADSASSVNSVDENSQEDESSQGDESSDKTTADESSQQETADSQSDETSADNEQSKTDDTSKSESSQPDKPQTTKPSKTDPPKTDPPKTDPPKTDPPRTDPPKTDPPASSGGLSANCSVVGNPWELDGKKCFQISITINNGTSYETNGWTVSITVPSGCEINDCWNGKAAINGTTLTITNLDYNGNIAAGGRTELGLIVKSPSEFTPTASVK